ncbi:MAG: hypothetical protein LBC85_05170 [Fibromonadaceae bacterium]|jgi:hypothetical protein|nr:hypothetical protein [Fibromonadaceae bacterium]
MKKTLAKIGLVLLIGGIISCDPRVEDNPIDNLLDNKLSSSSEDIQQSSSSADVLPSSSSAEGGDNPVTPLCNGEAYNPNTHFCYVNECASLPSCRINLALPPDVHLPCPAVCYREKQVFEKCSGREYDPNREVCFNKVHVICKNQLTNCGGCREYTDCQGNPTTVRGGLLCIERGANCGTTDIDDCIITWDGSCL